MSRTGRQLHPIIEGVVEKLVAEYRPEKIVLLGSYARGTPDADSDIDLLIIKDTPDRFLDRWAAVRRILSDPHRFVPLDTLVLTPTEVKERLDVGDRFIGEIVARGLVLYAA